MPAQVDACVTSLMSDWKSGKKRKPTRYKSGENWKPIKDDDDLRSAAWGICQASVGAEVDVETVELEEVEEIPFDNPVMTAIGATNKPHIMGLQRISTFEKDGEQWAKIPILILGRWFHRNGILNFNDGTVSKLKAALEGGVAGHDVAVDARHFSDRGALGWVRDFVTEALESGKKQVSALASLTKWGIEALTGKNPRFGYGSIEFHPNFKPRMVGESSALEFGDGVFILEEGEVPLTATWPDIQARSTAQEETMPDDKKPAAEQVDAISLDQFEQYKLEQQNKLQEMETRLEAERNRAISLEQFAVRQFVDAIVAKAENYRDSEGRAHSKYVLEWAENVLMCKQTGEGDDVIKLEADAGKEDIHAYYRRQIAALLQNAPGTVPMDTGQTEPDVARKLESNTEEADEKAARDEVLALFGKVPEGEEG